MKEYTKEEIADMLDLNDDKANNITRALQLAGIPFRTNGRRGQYYRIILEDVDNIVLFARKYLGIKTNYNEKLIPFLLLLIWDPQITRFASSRMLEHFLDSRHETIAKWKKALIDCGLLIEELGVEVYAATEREIMEDDGEDVYYYRKIRSITNEEAYSNSIAIYNNTKTNIYQNIQEGRIPYLCEEHIEYLANYERLRKSDWKWITKEPEFIYRINKDWPHLERLKAILAKYDPVSFESERLIYDECQHCFFRCYVGSHVKDEQRKLERETRWAKMEGRSLEIVEEKTIENKIMNNIIPERNSKYNIGGLLDEIIEDVQNI